MDEQEREIARAGAFHVIPPNRADGTLEHIERASCFCHPELLEAGGIKVYFHGPITPALREEVRKQLEALAAETPTEDQKEGGDPGHAC